MRKLIVFGHGDFGPALLESALATGIQTDNDSVFALNGQNMMEFRHHLDCICNTIYNKDSLLLLCDLISGSMMQEAFLVLEKRGLMNRMILIGGVSVPTLLAAIAFKDEIESAQELMETLKAQSEAGLVAIGLPTVEIN